MYLDYRIHIIDDDYLRRDKGDELNDLIVQLKETIENKGFHAKVFAFNSIDEANKNMPERVDYFLSDENLGGSNSGADFYHQLRKSYLNNFGDFILYTQNTKEWIIEKQIRELKEKKDPNLFSRFSFVARDLNRKWFAELTGIIEHSLSKREQMNTLRAIFAHETSKIHEALIGKFALSNETAFKTAISRITDIALNANLTEIRNLRNGLVHNTEVQDANGKFYIPYSSASDAFNVYSLKFDLSQSSDFLRKLKDVKTELMQHLGLAVD